MNIPQHVVRKIESRALACHYSLMAELLSEQGTLSRKELEDHCRAAASRFSALQDDTTEGQIDDA